MSFQEFAEELLGGRENLERKKRKSREIERKRANSSGTFFETVSDRDLEITAGDKNQKKKFDKTVSAFEKAEEDKKSGFIPQWLAEKKFGKTQARERSLNNKTPLAGRVEHETDGALLIESGGDQEWIPKSQFEEFESSGPDLSQSKREKAEDIMESRSRRARRADRMHAAPIADSFDEWATDPSHSDLPGVDSLGSGDSLDDLI